MRESDPNDMTSVATPKRDVRPFQVRESEVFDKRFFGSNDFVSEPLQPIGMAKNGRAVMLAPRNRGLKKIGDQCMPECPFRLAKVMGDGRSQIDLDDLQCFREQIPKRKVEVIRDPKIFKVVPGANEWRPAFSKARQ